MTLSTLGQNKSTADKPCSAAPYKTAERRSLLAFLLLLRLQFGFGHLFLLAIATALLQLGRQLRVRLLHLGMLRVEALELALHPCSKLSVFLLEGNFSCNFFRGSFDKRAYFELVHDYFVFLAGK